MESFGRRLKRLREENGLTQEALGKLLGVTQQAIGHYETNRNEPSRESIQIMAKKFNVSADYLLCITDDPTPQRPVSPPYDLRTVLLQPDMGAAFVAWHALKCKYNIPQDEYIRGEEEIVRHYGPLEILKGTGKVAHGPNIPGTGILSEDDED